jgi:hypothetical protein
MSEDSNRRRRRNVTQLNIDWVEIGVTMLAAEAEDPRNFTATREAIARDIGLSEAVARRVRRMAEDLRFVEEREPDFGVTVRRLSITVAEIILRWGRRDLEGARKAAVDFIEGKHTAASLTAAEHAARAVMITSSRSTAFVGLEEAVLDHLGTNEFFAGWSMQRLGAYRDFAAHSLDPDLAAAGVDAIAFAPGGVVYRLIMISHSNLDRFDPQFSRRLKATTWAAAGVAAQTGINVWTVVVAASEYPDVEKLSGRLRVSCPIDTIRIDPSALSLKL